MKYNGQFRETKNELTNITGQARNTNDQQSLIGNGKKIPILNKTKS